MDDLENMGPEAGIPTLGDLLEKIADKYPEDEDIQSALEMAPIEDDPEDIDGDLFGSELSAPGEEMPVDLDADIAEFGSLEEEEDEDELLMPKKPVL